MPFFEVSKNRHIYDPSTDYMSHMTLMNIGSLRRSGIQGEDIAKQLETKTQECEFLKAQIREMTSALARANSKVEDLEKQIQEMSQQQSNYRLEVNEVYSGEYKHRMCHFKFLANGIVLMLEGGTVADAKRDISRRYQHRGNYSVHNNDIHLSFGDYDQLEGKIAINSITMSGNGGMVMARC